jgi:hypothetical protein
MLLYASDICANGPDKERNPKKREKPLFCKWHGGQHGRVRVRVYVDPPETHSYSSARSLRQSEIALEQMRRPP